MRHPADSPTPTLDDLEAARIAYEAREPSDLFYRAATELVERMLPDDSPLELGTKYVDRRVWQDAPLNLAESLAVLLRTWNAAFYRFHERFDDKHLNKINGLVESYGPQLWALRRRSIATLSNDDEESVRSLFAAFAEVLGQVGAAKALHLLAPHFFPLWDTAIAELIYHVHMKKRGFNAAGYWTFMNKVKEQCDRLGDIGRNPLKALDEYNYIQSHPSLRGTTRLTRILSGEFSCCCSPYSASPAS